MFVIECEEKGVRGWVAENLMSSRLRFTDARRWASEYPTLEQAKEVAKRGQEFWDCTVVELEKS